MRWSLPDYGACFVTGRIPAVDGDFLSALLRVHSMEEREDQKDRLDFVRNQLNILTEDTKEKIKRVTEEVENKVSNGSGKNLPDASVLSCVRQLL